MKAIETFGPEAVEKPREGMRIAKTREFQNEAATIRTSDKHDEE